MGSRVFGVETEYGFSVLDKNGAPLQRAQMLADFMVFARRHLPHLPQQDGGGVFLQTGGRFYRDSGNHPELTTPEVQNPWDACRYLMAGDELLKEAVQKWSRGRRRVGRVVLSRGNVSYGQMQSTWASHENYGHRASITSLQRHLIPFFVSRTPMTGGGGFNNRCAGLEFLVSPRVPHLREVRSESSQSARGIFHLKEEPLCRDGSKRLHVLCGESVCSQLSMWLRMGTTALVVALIEAGGTPGEEFQLAKPVEALGTIGGDTTCTARVRLESGREVTAIEIQRHYLEEIEQRADDDVFPPWTAEVLLRWRELLDRLEQGAEAVSLQLDWAIKLELFRMHAERRGLDWTLLPVWTGVLEHLARAIQEAELLSRRTVLKRIPPELLLPTGPLQAELRTQASTLREHGLSWDDLDHFYEVRNELFGLDTRFSELSDEGVFAALDRQGVLEHHVPGVDNIAHAMEHPPAAGRAHLRGEAVRAYCGDNSHYAAGWSGVWDRKESQYLDLSSPLTETAEWQEMPAEDIPSPWPLFVRRRMVQQLTRLYNCGRFSEAQMMLDQLETVPERHRSAGFSPRMLQRLQALLHTRRGQEGGLSLLRELYDGREPSLSQTVDFLSILRYRSLQPQADSLEWIERGIGQLAAIDETGPVDANNLLTRSAAAVFHEHHGWWLLHQGDLEQAASELRKTMEFQERIEATQRQRLCAQATLGEVLRRQGRTEEAARELDEAAAAQTAHGFEGDLAEITLPAQAHLASSREQAMTLLEQAEAIQRQHDHETGLVQTLLFMVQWDDDREEEIHRELVAYCGRLPLLRQCPVCRDALADWGGWIAGQQRMWPAPAFASPATT